jgi:hypothetical protein
MTKTLLRSLAAAAVLASAVLAASCILLDNPEGEEPGWRTFPDQGVPRGATEFRRTLEFAAGGTLSLENDYGDVSITGWDRDQVEVLARAATVEKQPDTSARPYRIRKVTPEVEIQETASGGLLIRTPTFEGTGEAPAIDFEIKVPNSVILAGLRMSEGDLSIADVYGRVEASIDQGSLSVTNFSGALRATLGVGSADVEALDLREGDEITITTRRGDLDLRLEPNTNAIVEADAGRGEVTSDFALGTKLPAPAVKGWIGQGGPSIILRTGDGRIRIIRTPA